jgi:hypothetical protein
MISLLFFLRFVWFQCGAISDNSGRGEKHRYKQVIVVSSQSHTAAISIPAASAAPADAQKTAVETQKIAVESQSAVTAASHVLAGAKPLNAPLKSTFSFRALATSPDPGAAAVRFSPPPIPAAATPQKPVLIPAPSRPGVSNQQPRPLFDDSDDEETVDSACPAKPLTSIYELLPPRQWCPYERKQCSTCFLPADRWELNNDLLLGGK